MKKNDILLVALAHEQARCLEIARAPLDPLHPDYVRDVAAQAAFCDRIALISQMMQEASPCEEGV